MLLAPSDNVLVPQHFGCLLYVRSRHEYLPYDPLSYQVLASCCSRPLKELPAELATQIPPERLRAFHKLGRSLGFLDRAGRFLGRCLDARPPRDHLLGPLTLHLGVTRDCELRCRHCFASPEMEQGEPLLDPARLERLLDECVELGCLRIALTGGEPLSRPDFFPLVDRIAARGIDVCLTTNGLRLQGPVVRELQRRPFAWLNVSLDGASEESNDWVRGPGTFRRVTDNLRRHLRGKVRYALSVTLHRRNLHELGQLVPLARKLGAEALLLRAVFPIGRAARHLDDLAITQAEYLHALEELKRQPARSLHVVPMSCEEPVGEQSAVIHQGFGCAAGQTVATVLAHGDVSPCSLIGGLPLDNLRRGSLAELWHDSEAFTRLRSTLPPLRCCRCEQYPSCAGGCRARAWAATGRLDSPDPWCSGPT